MGMALSTSSSSGAAFLQSRARLKYLRTIDQRSCCRPFMGHEQQADAASLGICRFHYLFVLLKDILHESVLDSLSSNILRHEHAQGQQ